MPSQISQSLRSAYLQKVSYCLKFVFPSTSNFAFSEKNWKGAIRLSLQWPNFSHKNCFRRMMTMLMPEERRPKKEYIDYFGNTAELEFRKSQIHPQSLWKPKLNSKTICNHTTDTYNKVMYLFRNLSSEECLKAKVVAAL